MVLEDEVFIGHGVMFTNDLYPYATNEDDSLKTDADWGPVKTRVKCCASIGSNAIILPGGSNWEKAIIGAGAVVTHDVADYAIVARVPARRIGDFNRIQNPEMTASNFS